MKPSNDRLFSFRVVEKKYKILSMYWIIFILHFKLTSIFILRDNNIN